MFLATVVSGDGPGAVCADVELRVASFPNSLFQRRASTWERMTIKSMKVNYSPSIPTTINCNLITYHEPDITDVPISGTQALNVALAHNKATQHAANVNRTIQTSCPHDKLWTSEGSDNRLDAFGRIVCVQRQAPVDFGGNVLPAGTPLGDLVMEVDVMFESPNLDVATASEQPTLGFRFIDVAVGTPLQLVSGEFACLVDFSMANPALTAGITMQAPGDNDPGIILAHTVGLDGAGTTVITPVKGPVNTVLLLTNVAPVADSAGFRFAVFANSTALFSPSK